MRLINIMTLPKMFAKITWKTYKNKESTSGNLGGNDEERRTIYRLNLGKGY